MEIPDWAIFIFIVFVIMCLIFGALESMSKDDLKRIVGSQGEYIAEYFYVGLDGNSAVSANKDLSCFIISSHYNGQRFRFVANVSDILEVQLSENGRTISKENRIGQAGKAALGGLMFGGAGAIVGALMHGATHEGIVSRIDVHLTINHPQCPLVTINFLRSEVESGSGSHMLFRNKANEWVARFKYAIHQADKSDGIQHSDNHGPVLGVAEEIKKLVELRGLGIITDDEFNRQKARLLT